MALEINSASRISLRDDEEVRSTLKFKKFREHSSWRPGEITLTNQRLLYVEGQGSGSISRWGALDEVSNARMTGKPRDRDILLMAAICILLTVLIGYGMGAAFSGGYGTVTPPVLIVGFAIAVGAVLWWWFDGGNAVVQLNIGDATVYAQVTESMHKPVYEFLQLLHDSKTNTISGGEESSKTPVQ